MKNYIFLTDEGTTFQPDRNDEETGQVENLQVLGIASGADTDDAYNNLLVENSHLLDSAFENIFCYELSDSYERTRKNFRLRK